MGQIIQEQTDDVKFVKYQFFKDYLPQILFGPFLNKQSILKQNLRNFVVRWDKVFENGPGEICGRRGKQPLKNFTWSILEYFVPDIEQVAKSYIMDLMVLLCSLTIK